MSPLPKDEDPEALAERILARFEGEGLADISLRPEVKVELALEARPAVHALLFGLGTDRAGDAASLEHHESLAMVTLLGRALARLELVKMLALAGLIAALAGPVGLALAWVLVAVVNVQAFGWRLPLHLFPLQWLAMAGLALLTALIASALPLWRLARTPPARLAQAFSHER